MTTQRNMAMLGCDFFFFKQKTAYEITRRDWSSDVCSSDLGVADDRVDLGVARGADGDRGFEQHQPLEEWAQGVADGAVNPVSSAVIDAGLCRLADDVVHIVDEVVVVAGPAEHGVGAGITVHGVVTGPAQERIVTA